MREIKFRAWDKKRGHFHWGISNVCLTLGGNLMWQFGYNAPSMLDKEEAEEFALQQYTGLKDKNGKEIYEGDIVTKRFFNSISCQRTFEVVIPDIYYVWQTMADEEWEVIGNIYENPLSG